MEMTPEQIAKMREASEALFLRGEGYTDEERAHIMAEKASLLGPEAMGAIISARDEMMTMGSSAVMISQDGEARHVTATEIRDMQANWAQGFDASHGEDQTQSLLNFMAQQNIERALADAVKLDILQQQADAMNASGATIMSRYRSALNRSTVLRSGYTVH